MAPPRRQRESATTATSHTATLPNVEMSSDPLTSANAPSITPRQWIGKRKASDSENIVRASVQIRPAVPALPTGKRIRIPIPPSSPPTATLEPVDEDSDEEEEDDSEDEDQEISHATDRQMDIVATKLLTLLRPELRRMQKKQNKQYRTISARLEKIEESLSAGFFLASNHTPKLDYLVNRVSADGDASATPIPPPPPLTIPTTNNTTEHIESAGLQPSYADILRLSKPEGQETTNKKPTKRDNSLSRVKRTITIARSDNGLPPVDPLTIRNTLNATLRDIQAPPNAIISTVTLNQKNNYILTTREDCPASTVLQYKETLQSTLQNIDNTTAAMKPQETWAKVAVHGINLLAYPDDTIGMELLQKEVETHNPGVTLTTTPRYITRPENRTGKRDSSIVICVASESLANQLTKKGVLIDCQRRKSERYWAARPSDQCSSCQGFGHHWKRCVTNPICRLCAQAHKTGDHVCPQCPSSRGKQCPHTVLRCINCDMDHHASDRTCPVITKLRGLPRNRNTNEIAAADQIAPTLTGTELANAGARWDETNPTGNQLPQDDDSMEVSHGSQY